MSTIILRFTRDSDVRYLEWSTVVDAPVTHGMRRDTFERYYVERYGARVARELPERLQRAEMHGSSSFVNSFDDLIAVNRAGPSAACITLDQIWDRYCK